MDVAPDPAGGANEMVRLGMAQHEIAQREVGGGGPAGPPRAGDQGVAPEGTREGMVRQGATQRRPLTRIGKLGCRGKHGDEAANGPICRDGIVELRRRRIREMGQGGRVRRLGRELDTIAHASISLPRPVSSAAGPAWSQDCVRRITAPSPDRVSVIETGVVCREGSIMKNDPSLPIALAFAEAAFDGAPLTAPLEMLARAAAADEALAYRLEPGGGWSDVQRLRTAGDVLAAYRRLGPAQNPRARVWAAAPAAEPIDFDRSVPAESLECGPLGALMRQTGFPARHLCGIRIPLGGGSEARLALGRNRGAFDGAVFRLLAAIGPHLAAALRARAVLSHPADAGRDGGLAELEALPAPLALIDAAPRLVHANAALRSLAGRRDGLLLGRTRLMAADPSADAALAAACDLARATASGAPPLHAVAVPRSGRPRPYLVQAVTIGDLAGARRGVLFAVTDPDAAVPDHAMLRRLLGLTRAEAELAARLARGATLAEAARARGISPETARTQLKSVLGKTGCAGQAELARLLARLGGAERRG